MLNKQLIQRVEGKVVETLILAQDKFKQVFELPSISYDINSGRTAGLAYLRDWHIKINPKYLEAYPNEVIGKTVIHEIAHLIAFRLYPDSKQAHGPQWKHVANQLGIEPVRCHQMQLVEASPHTYICNCQKHFVTNLIHRKMVNGQRRFCRKCKSQVVYLNTK